MSTAALKRYQKALPATTILQQSQISMPYNFFSQVWLQRRDLLGLESTTENIQIYQ